jgi:serine/threonine protein kinase
VTRVERVFHAALERGSAERADFLDNACGGDAGLRRRVEWLLAQDAAASQFLETPAVSVAARRQLLTAAHDPCAPVVTAPTDATATIAAGTSLGPYEIRAKLGAGSMGDVYCAHDRRLHRDVALKILPDPFPFEPNRVDRFQREARVLAALNHPNIAAIYDFEHSAGAWALVLELVEGPTLADRIEHGPIRSDDAIPIASQIGAAVEYAHENGVVHRDLKPANIKVRADGTVKVLDFGLATMLEARPANDRGSSESGGTPSSDGAVCGTPAYMSPEQVRGQKVDRRADVWAFGCVLFEMLTGSAAFRGDTPADILVAVMSTDPDWRLLPASTPVAIRRLLARCLQKDARRRLRDIGDALLDLEEARTGPGEAPAQLASARHRYFLFAGILSLVALTAASVVGLLIRQSTVAGSELRLEIATPGGAEDNTAVASLAISPDGKTLALVATSDGRAQLWVRPLGSASGHFVSGTEGSSFPFWSPDSRSIGFFGGGKLKRVGIDGGPVQAIADAPAGRGASWSADDTILFTPTNSSPIMRVAASGGRPMAVTRLGPNESVHAAPVLLPDGEHFLFYVPISKKARGVNVGRLDASDSTRLLDTDGSAVYASGGRLLFVRQGALFAQDFDAKRLQLSGEPFAVADRIAMGGSGIAAVSASASGPIVYRAGSGAARRQLVWVDRAGREISKIGEPTTGAALNPSLSPDGHLVALQRSLDGNIDIWQLDVERGALSRLISNPATEVAPLWSPDGEHIVFTSTRNGSFDLYQKSISHPETEELILSSPHTKSVTDWSLDGRWLLYRDVDPKTGFDIWALPVDGPRKPFAVVQTDADERDAQFSPDGKWIAYASNEAGRFDVYLQSFPAPPRKWLVSTNGGAQPRWRRDGRELFYVTLDGRLAAVPIQLNQSREGIDISAPAILFSAAIGGAIQGMDRHQYIASGDGQRFLLNRVADESASPITVILNWKGKP